LEDETAKSTLLKGTLGFIAPELHELTPAGTPFAADMWALGEIAFQLMTKQPVFKSFGRLAGFATQNDTFPSGELLTYHVSTPGQDFIFSLMVPTPGRRLTAEAALKHQWMMRYLSSAVQPPLPRQSTSIVSTTSSITDVLASWNSISISSSDSAKTLRLNRSGDNQPPHNHSLGQSTPEDVRGQTIPPEKVAYHLGKLSGHAQAVWSVAFSPNGATIASGSTDGLVKIWDAATGKQLQELSGHTDAVLSVAFSPDGATIASGSDRLVRIWDAATGMQLLDLNGHTGEVWSMAFSPDGSTIASGSADCSVRIWDVAAGRQLRELSSHTERVWSVAFSPDGVTIASGSGDRLIRIWDAITGELLRKLSGHTKEVLSVAFSPDGATIASGSTDRTVRIWDTATGMQLRELYGYTGWDWSVVFSPDGATIASGSGDRSIKIWNAATGRQLRELSGHTGEVWSVAFSPDGATIVSGSADCSVRTWDIKMRRGV
jgi:WD40 repeat protein